MKKISNNKTTPIDIDLVYLWVDGNDPKWRTKHDSITSKTTHASLNCKGRFADNDELKHSLRSVELYAPWIRKIFIVTDDQKPKWLDTSNPKIQIVDITEILPPQSLPCFNSNVIEHCLYRIPDLAEHFLYANDDMFLNKPVTPDTFFAPDGLPIVRLFHRSFRKLVLYYRIHIRKRDVTPYVLTIKKSAELVEKKYGHYFNAKPHHNIDTHLKSDYQDTAEIFKDAIEPTFSNHLRSANDVQRIIYTYAALAKKRAHLSYTTPKISFRVPIHHEKFYLRLEKYNPTFFCMNDSNLANDNDRRKAAEYLEKRFPKKSQFEK